MNLWEASPHWFLEAECQVGAFRPPEGPRVAWNECYT